MSLQDNLENPAIEKHALAIIRPRVRHTGWADYDSLNVWNSEFSLGYVTRVWRNAATEFESVASIGALTSQTFYYDHATQQLYVHNGNTDPDDEAAMDSSFDADPGMTVEYEIHVSSKEFTAPRDPFNANSDVVDWVPALLEMPAASSGSADSLYGFNPSQSSSLRVANNDGWLNLHMHASSFLYAPIEIFILVASELEPAIVDGNVKEIFNGFCDGRVGWDSRDSVSFSTADFLTLLDRSADPAERFSVGEFGSVDPAAVRAGQEWWIRRVRGMVDNFLPVNVDFSATPATNINRDWVTHEGTGTDGTFTATVDHAAANTNTKTFFTTTPKFNVGDSFFMINDGVTRYSIVSAVDRASKWIEHGSFAGRSVIAGDSATRYYVGWVRILDENGTWWNLFPGRDFTRINKSTFGNNPDWLGFRLTDNFEATIGFPSTFDPNTHKIMCRVYGTQTIDTYSDSSAAGAVSDNGGVASEAVSLLHYLLRRAGIPNALIDPDSFDDVASHDLGVAIPSDRASEPLTYRDIIGAVLFSMLWRLGYVDSSNQIRIGLAATEPFQSAANYELDETTLANPNFSLDYGDVYDAVALIYAQKETIADDDGSGTASQDQITLTTPDRDLYVQSTNRNARDLHQVRKTFTGDILQFVTTQAQTIADRYGFALGERRGKYSVEAPAEYLSRLNIGASYNLEREQMPGYEFESGTVRERQLAIVAVQKSGAGVKIDLEDQKGIQDNSGEW